MQATPRTLLLDVLFRLFPEEKPLCIGGPSSKDASHQHGCVTGTLGQRSDSGVPKIRFSHLPQKSNRKGNGEKQVRNFNQLGSTGGQREVCITKLSGLN